MRAFLLLTLTAGLAIADANFVPLDGADKEAVHGYRLLVTGTDRRDISLELTPAAAKAFLHGDLVLTRSGKAVAATVVGLRKDKHGGGTFFLMIDPRAVDGGELYLWSKPIDGEPAVKDFAGFRLDLAPLLVRSPAALMAELDGYRKKLPEPQGLGEMNGTGVPDVDGVAHPDSHLKGIANRLNVATKAECHVLLTYLKDKDPKMRRIAAFALEGVVKAYPNGMSSDDVQDVESDGHRKMVAAFLAGIDKLPR